MPRVHLPDDRIVNFPYDMTPEQIQAEVVKLVGSSNTQQPPRERSWTDTVVNALPTIGGAVGGIVGRVPVLGTALAGLAGAGGEGYRQTIEALRGNFQNVPETMGGRIRSMAQAGMTQAGAEGIGHGVGRLLTGAAKGLYRGALRPSAAVRAKTPDVVERGLADRILVGPRGAKGKALEGVRTSKAAADTAVAGQAGASPITSREVRRGLMPEVDRAKREVAAGLPNSMRTIAARAQTIPKSVSLQEGHSIARTLNDAADPAFKAANRGGAPVGLEHRLNKGLAQAYSSAVKDRVPSLATINKTTMDRMGLAKALGAAAERPSVLANVAAGGVGVGELFRGGDPGNALMAAMAVKGLSSPRTLSGAALGMNEVGRYPGMIANAMRAALLAAMNSEDR